MCSKMFRLSFLVAALLSAGGGRVAAGSHWGYPDLNANEEFPKWGGLCDVGTLQSPINLSLRGALKGVFARLEFGNYGQKQSDVSLVNNGHTVQLFNFPIQMELQGGPLLAEYVLEQIHFHWWSEHTVDNIRFPLEAHIVHRNTRYANVSTAIRHKDGLAIIGVLYHVSNKRNAAIDKIIENLDEIGSFKKLNVPTTMKSSFRVSDLFPHIDGYMTYEGSLTTPPCSEAVTWIVMSETFPVTLDQVKRFKEIERAEGKSVPNNYRFIQKANNRPVVVVFSDNEANSPGSGSTARASVYAALLVVLLAQLLH